MSTDTKSDTTGVGLGQPGHTGWETATKLNSSTAIASIPILVLSVPSTSMDRKKRLMQAVAKGKPVNLPRILGKIEALIRKQTA